MKHLLPTDAWTWLQAERERRTQCGLKPPLFLDVRMEIESLYVGRPPGVLHIAWYEYPDLTADPAAFVTAVNQEANGDKSLPMLLICRNGRRTLDAGYALEIAGFSEVVYVLHGFEGDLNTEFQRSTVNGWRFEGLPWEQM